MAGATSQPQDSATLDASNSLTVGLSDVWVASIGKTLVKNYTAARSGANASPTTVIEGTGPNGKFIRGDAVTTLVGFGIAEGSNSILGSTDTTWFIVRRCRDTVTRNIFIHYGYENGANSRCLLAPDGSTVTWDYGNATGGSGRLQAPYAKDTLMETLVVVAGQVKGREIWRRGVKIGSNANAKALRTQDNRSFGIGRPEGGPVMDDVETYMFGVANREWSDAEITSWSANPWQIFEGEAPAGVDGAASWAEQSDTAQAQASIKANAAAGWTEASEVSAAQGTVGSMAFATAAWTEQSEVFAAQATIVTPTTAAIGWTEASEIVAIQASAVQTPTATAGWVEASEVFAALANVEGDPIPKPETTMQKYFNAYLGPTGIAIRRAVVTVTKSDGTPAVIYSDNGVTPITSLLTGDDGEFAFYAENGRYNITLKKRGLRDEIVTDVQIFDPEDDPGVRETELAAADGSSLMGFKQAGTGAATRTVQDKLRETVSPADYVTLQQALDTGKIVRLVDGATYPVASQLVVPSGGGMVGKATLTVSSANFAGTTAGPSSANVPILAQNVINVTLKDFKIVVTAGQNSVLYPIALRGVSKGQISDIEVTGMNGGAAIKVDSCQDIDISRPHVHDCTLDRLGSSGQMTGVEVDNDKIAGVGSQRVHITDPNIYNLTVTPAFLTAYGYQTDGVNIQVGASACTVSGGVIDKVGEGVDLFCDDSKVSGVLVRDAYIFGIKLVHGASRNLIDGNRIINPGLGGVTVGGSSTAAKNADRNTISNNHVSGVNSTGAWTADVTYAYGTGNDGTYKATNTLFRSNRCTESAGADYHVSLGGTGAGNKAAGNMSDGSPQAELFGTAASLYRTDRVGDGSGLAYVGGTNARVQWDSESLRFGGVASAERFSDVSQFGVITQRYDDNGVTIVRNNLNYGVAGVGHGTSGLTYFGRSGAMIGVAHDERVLTTGTWLATATQSARHVRSLALAGVLTEVIDYDPAKGLSVLVPGTGLRVKEGANAKQGVATLSGGTVTVANTSVTASSRIFPAAQDGNTVGALRVTKTAGTGFTITSSNAADSGVVAYQIFEPA